MPIKEILELIPEQNDFSWIFHKKLQSLGTDFFTGVPDSLLKPLCAWMKDNLDTDANVIAANEGGQWPCRRTLPCKRPPGVHIYAELRASAMP